MCIGCHYIFKKRVVHKIFIVHDISDRTCEFQKLQMKMGIGRSI